ncbi:DUF2778 domain-containing protein [Sinomicrobium weinanense]|uniref:DUF2778 domain-containing protein n=1 Tax=Sinomicrobium weinanense TaxID=2842200 RepID=A0A926Q432_9FLAO|nr:DUF2778 domain-containing protein [Sinomicrobium weinanense]MBC9798188.1 DUF2778 domain-containing protein [Sinomicrobium weinanense]MBU3125486.1 DUF2778 domain-containing protein [Sinomicrobium weinanense]
MDINVGSINEVLNKIDDLVRIGANLEEVNMVLRQNPGNSPGSLLEREEQYYLNEYGKRSFIVPVSAGGLLIAPIGMEGKSRYQGRTEPQGVVVVFNRSTGRLALIDLDHYKEGLPGIKVSASDYKTGGIRDSNGHLTHNQILVVQHVFTGGQADHGIVTRNPDKPMQRPIPDGRYDILDNDADTRHSGWFRLDSKDGDPYNDRDETTARDGFRWHMGTESWGCVTHDVSVGDRQEEWDVIMEILNTTSTTTVPERRGKQGWNPFSRLTRYGVMIIKKE